MSRDKHPIPNETTLQTFRDTDAGENIVIYADAAEMFARLGIEDPLPEDLTGLEDL